MAEQRNHVTLNEDVICLTGQVIQPYVGSAWTRTNIGWPFGQLQLRGDTIRLSARWPQRFFHPVTLRREDVTGVERTGPRTFGRLGSGVKFRSDRPEVDGITFFAYGRKAAALERLLASFFDGSTSSS